MDQRTVVDLWRIACADHPNNVAIEDDTVTWTYRELGERVDAWSSRIAQLPPTTTQVAIHLPHGAETVAAAIGVVAAGRSFVALDPDHPFPQRLAHLDFCEAEAIICCADDAETFRNGGFSGTMILPNNITSTNSAPSINIQPDWLAYFHFSSGSSGKPKAVAIPHRTATCAVAHAQMMFELTPADRHALMVPLHTPAATAQIFTVLSTGAALCLFEARKHSATQTNQWLKERRITTIQMVPSLLRILGREAGEKRFWPQLRAMKLGGEPAFAIDAGLFAKCAAENAVLINGLGLTEASFNVCWTKVRAGQLLMGELLPIGRPPATLEIVVESAPGRASATGELGEIVVRSPYLPLGYWRDPERTAANYRTMENRPGWRELRTGDIGCWRSDGLLEHRGRLDDMVKIRGHSVAPSEVEAVLSMLNGVAAAAVTAEMNSAGKYLHAFVQLEPGAALTSADLRRELATRVPGYMLPAQIHVLDALPYLPNGKIDRLKLLAWQPVVIAGQPSPTESIDSITIQLLSLWQDALGAKQIEVTDDFFDLGGDSLAAAAIFAGMEKFLSVDLPISTLLEAPTIQRLVEKIRKSDWSEENLRLVALQLRGSRPPLYCIPGAGCEAIIFRHLANHLGSDQPCFAFQPQGLDGRQPYLRTVEEMAVRYLNILKQHQNRGPYYLCGSSFGGTVAFEMAHRLLLQGDSLAFIGLIDTYAGNYPQPRKNLSWQKKLRLVLQDLPSVANEELGWSFISKGLPEWWRLKRIRLDLAWQYRALPRPYTERFLYLKQACYMARRQYKYRPFSGQVDLFRVEQELRHDLYESDPLLGWGSANTRIEIHDLPGRHGSELQEPNVSALAKKIRHVLEKRQRSAESEQRRESARASTAKTGTERRSSRVG